METVLRIREVTPSERMADRLEMEANRLSSAQKKLADDYRRQAAMLREMSEIRQVLVRETLAGSRFAGV